MSTLSHDILPKLEASAYNMRIIAPDGIVIGAVYNSGDAFECLDVYIL
jgi:hypothetical protein